MAETREDECCGICAFWKSKKSEDFVEITKTTTKGECHRNPPQINGHLTDFPTVKDIEWCGEFRRASSGDKYLQYNKAKDEKQAKGN